MQLIFQTEEHYLYYQKWKDLRHLYKYKHSVILPKVTHSPWLGDEIFLDVYNRVEKNSLVDIYRCYELFHLVQQVNHLNGNIIEVGVWKGGTAAIIGKAMQGHGKLYLCDTFEGVVKASEKDNRYFGGEHSDTSEETVTNLLEELEITNYQIIKGVFPDENFELLQDKQISFCHIDVDVYQSAKDVFENVWPQMMIGGIIVFDDYGHAACEGIITLVNELKNNTDNIMLHNINGHAVFIKIR